MADLYGIAVASPDGGITVEERRIDPDKLARQLRDIRDAIAPIMDGGSSPFPLQSVEVGLSVSAEGSVVFVTASVTASITLTFERPRG